jgi:tetratricopeptide (TPR) repeat protein
LLYAHTNKHMAQNNVDNDSVHFMVVWLDNSIEKTKQNRDTKVLIRQSVRGRLLTFDNSDECVDYITTELAKEVFLIISTDFGQHVVPLIYQSPYIRAIYVYCGNRRKAEEWAKPNLKVSGIFIEKQSLIKKIQDDVPACDIDNQLPMSVFHIEEQQRSLQDLTKESATFMWYQLLLIVLRRMAKFGDSKNEMIGECRTSYHDNEAEKKKINDFEQRYAPEGAFWWYTYDSFIYRLLNRALRTQNTEIIFKFRFFINDLHNQIEKLYLRYLEAHQPLSAHRLTLYRGQFLDSDELNKIKGNINGLISMNSFLSATSIREVAEIFAGTNSQCDAASAMQSVFFIIDVDDMSKETTPFAFIQEYACCPAEEEVLFTIGATFRVQSVKQVDDRWHIHLQLSKQQNQLHLGLSQHMMKQIGSEPSPTAFGWFLYRTSDFNKAERFAKLLLEQLPPNHKEVGDIYNLLGLIYKDTNRREKAVECYEKALDIFSHSSEPDSPQVIATHYNIGLAYLALDNHERADEHQKQAKGKLISSSQSRNPFLIAMTDVLKGKVQTAQGDYTAAFTSLEEVLKIKKRTLPSKHPSIASTLNAMGIVQEKMSNHQKALDYFKKALDICCVALGSKHLDLAECHTNTGRMYFQRKQYAVALQHFESALALNTNDIRDVTDETVTLKNYIAQTKLKIK